MSILKLRRKLKRIISWGLRERTKVEKEGKVKERTPPASPLAGNKINKIYLKALSLRSLEEIDRIKDEIRSGNILIVKIEPLAEKSIEDVNRAINELNEFIGAIGGDIARLGEERIVLTPPNVKIWREKTQAPA